MIYADWSPNNISQTTINCKYSTKKLTLPRARQYNPHAKLDNFENDLWVSFMFMRYDSRTLRPRLIIF